jgi:hypothetical protein
MMLFSVVTLGLVSSVGAYTEGNIYPAGHFDRSVGLTVDTFDNFIKDSVDSGKTAFVRWIASEG